MPSAVIVVKIIVVIKIPICPACFKLFHDEYIQMVGQANSILARTAEILRRLLFARQSSIREGRIGLHY